MLDALHVLAAGSCEHPEAMTRGGAGWRPCRFAGGFALLVHRRFGPVLFDTGYAPAFLRATRRLPNAVYRWLTPVQLDDGETAVAQLAVLGVAPRDVSHVVVSHFHADHVAALNDFPAARIVCSRSAWESVRGRRGLAALRRGFLAELMPADAAARVTFTDDRPSVPLPGALAAFGAGRDLFDDGSVLAVDLPGHARGQIGVWLPGAPGGASFLIGDAAWSHDAYERELPPPRVTTALLGETSSYRTTLHRLHLLHLAQPALRIVPSHALPR